MNASALGQLLHRAEADEPVYVTDVRRTFLEEGGEPLAVHSVMFDGTSRCFRLRVPAWTSREEKDFVLQEEEVGSVRWMDFQECVEGVKSGGFRHCIAIEELMMVKRAAGI